MLKFQALAWRLEGLHHYQSKKNPTWIREFRRRVAALTPPGFRLLTRKSRPNLLFFQRGSIIFRVRADLLRILVITPSSKSLYASQTAVDLGQLLLEHFEGSNQI